MVIPPLLLLKVTVNVADDFFALLLTWLPRSNMFCSPLTRALFLCLCSNVRAHGFTCCHSVCVQAHDFCILCYMGGAFLKFRYLKYW